MFTIVLITEVKLEIRVSQNFAKLDTGFIFEAKGTGFQFSVLLAICMYMTGHSWDPAWDPTRGTS